jgi:fatty-acyl-CoA synthase
VDRRNEEKTGMALLTELKSNLVTIAGLQRTLRLLEPLTPEATQLLPDDIEDAVDRYPGNVAIRFRNDVWTYRDIDVYANRVAHWAREQGLGRGDCVALFMENRAEYVPIWYGLSKIGVVTALINHNLQGDALAHCIDIVDARHLVFGAQQDAAIDSVEGRLAGVTGCWTLGGETAGTRADFSAAVAPQPDARPDRACRAELRGADLALYVYTSGTTGLPKAARLTHMRVQAMMRTFIAPCRFTQRDRIYITLPLYHGTGGLCGVGAALNTGASIILREKFSASHFWDDAVDYRATAFTYIGELCRYLLNTPAHPRERQHRIRTGFGNGLRPEIWERFFQRFGIPHLAEFYGSTEGNVSFVNFDGKVGAVGKIPPLLAGKFSNIRFVKFDVETEMPLRGADGFCMECDPDEPGEVIGWIGDDLRGRFEGYNDTEATRRKILSDVFEKGDRWFRTGDLMRKDANGYVYFVDRIGDTFRWKGENVSTNEVAEVLSRYPGIETANVYGVPVPGMDGKAGMAAITAAGDLDLAGLWAFLAAELPAYAVPLFLRRQDQAVTTGTFKYRKVELVNEGFDPAKVTDPMWFANAAGRSYRPLTPRVYERIVTGEQRL